MSGRTAAIVMPQQPTILDRAAAAVSDWTFLVAGVTLLGLALVMPTWLACRDLASQRDLMRLQVANLNQQQGRYHQFHRALLRRDPVLLERLAFTQLGLTPAGKQVMDASAATEGAGGARGASGGAMATSASIDRWLLEPMPRIGVDLPPTERVSSRLTRITTSPVLRVGLIAAAVACLAAGLWPSRDAAAAAAPARAHARPHANRHATARIG